MESDDELTLTGIKRQSTAPPSLTDDRQEGPISFFLSNVNYLFPLALYLMN